ncbi:hypothetical protein BDW69DRAFT_5367 [Aspergillus filifer]
MRATPTGILWPCCIGPRVVLGLGPERRQDPGRQIGNCQGTAAPMVLLVVKSRTKTRKIEVERDLDVIRTHACMIFFRPPAFLCAPYLSITRRVMRMVELKD